jgi:hypothetical protein
LAEILTPVLFERMSACVVATLAEILTPVLVRANVGMRRNNTGGDFSAGVVRANVGCVAPTLVEILTPALFEQHCDELSQTARMYRSVWLGF